MQLWHYKEQNTPKQREIWGNQRATEDVSHTVTLSQWPVQTHSVSDKSRSHWKLQTVQGEGLRQFRGRRTQRTHTLRLDRQTDRHAHGATYNKRTTRKKERKGESEMKYRYENGKKSQDQQTAKSQWASSTWEGGEVEKEVVQTSCESWTPAYSPPSSSSGALDTHTHIGE